MQIQDEWQSKKRAGDHNRKAPSPSLLKQSREFQYILNDPALWKNCAIAPHMEPLGGSNPDFLWGVATSMYQDSGAVHCPESQWSRWEKRNLAPEEQSGSGAHFFEFYRKAPLEIIKRLQLLGVNTYRFSIEWSHIEPQQGSFNKENLQIYIQFCKILRDHHIQPFITLHHFSEPLWFHRLGSFEKEDNIAHFLEFTKYAFKELIQVYQGRPLVQYFCTINEPGIEAYCRYLIGLFSPNLYARFNRGAQFLLNTLKAHCRVYSALKVVAEEQKCAGIHIGICHQYLCYRATHFIMHPVAQLLNKFNESVLIFFKTGRFICKVPLLCNIEEDCAKTETPRVDFAGVQFYGRTFLGLRGIDSKNKPATTMLGMHEDPEGLFEAIVTIFEAFNAPVLISENGISTESDEQRARYLSRALYAAEQARQKIGSKNMLGYILWSFSDNFEWSFGWKPRFGAFSLNQDRTLSAHYKPGVQPFVESINAWKHSLVK